MTSFPASLRAFQQSKVSFDELLAQAKQLSLQSNQEISVARQAL